MKNNEVYVTISIMEIYDKFGKPRARVRESRIVDLKGKSLGFISQDSIYDYNGHHKAWFIGGVVRDHKGAIVGFTKNAQIPGILPLKALSPISPINEIEPIRPIKSIKPIRPIFGNAWSNKDLIKLILE